MAISGAQKAYRQARSGIARSGATRSNYVTPLYGVISINGFDVTTAINTGTLRVHLALNEEPDTASFDVRLVNALVQDQTVVGSDVLIGLGGPYDNLLFGGRILTAQTAVGPARTASVRSVLCADYLQVLDAEYLITYDWPAQSATATILDLIARFANKPGGVPISPAGVQLNLPNHAAIGVINERFSTFLRRLVTMFPGGGGFYVDPLKVLHVWQGASEPDTQNPAMLTIESPQVKAFAETEDGSQQRDAAIVEGYRTTAPIGTPGPDPGDPSGRNLASIPVLDASILDPVHDAGVDREVRINTQRLTFRIADGVWSSPPGTPQTTKVVIDVPYNPDPGIDDNTVQIWIAAADFLTGRERPWVRIDQQYLKVVTWLQGASPWIKVPRTGYGAMIGAIAADAVVTAIDSLASGYVTGRYDAPGAPEQLRPQPIDADVVMVVRSATGLAVHEQIIQDGRYSRAGAATRGTREVLDFYQPLIAVTYATDDLNVRPGRRQAYSLTQGPGVTPLVGQYMILTADLTWPAWGYPPRRACTAADVQAANVVDTWLVDRR